MEFPDIISLWQNRLIKWMLLDARKLTRRSREFREYDEALEGLVSHMILQTVPVDYYHLCPPTSGSSE